MIRSESVEKACEQRALADSITLHRDPQTDEWVFDLSPGLDLLEVARVLTVVQQQALHLLQQQLHTASANGPQPLPPVSTALPTPNSFAQL